MARRLEIKSAILRQPLCKPGHALAPAPRPPQVERAPRGLRVGHVPALIALAPILEAELDFAPDDRADLVDQLKQADGILRSAAEVECVPRNAADIVERRDIGVHRVADVEDVADLLAVAVDRDRLTLECTDQEMRD